MDKADLLRSIAESGYNVGFGAKKHFATFDIVSKVPGLVGYVSLVVGVFALFIEAMTDKVLSATLIGLGILAVHIAPYDRAKDAYSEAGRRLTESFAALKTLYFRVKAASDTDLNLYIAEQQRIESACSSVAIADQIMFSGWFAHYKFFWEQQIGWIEEQKRFGFWRDKVPLSFSLTAAAAVIGLIIITVNLPSVRSVIGSLLS